MSALEQFNRDLAWGPWYLMAGFGLGWKGALAVFLTHWAWNYSRAKLHTPKEPASE
jgi:hypothetical protein